MIWKKIFSLGLRLFGRSKNRQERRDKIHGSQVAVMYYITATWQLLWRCLPCGFVEDELAFRTGEGVAGLVAKVVHAAEELAIHNCR